MLYADGSLVLYFFHTEKTGNQYTTVSIYSVSKYMDAGLFFSYWRCKRKRLMLLVLPSIVCLVLFGIKLNENEGNPISKIHYEDVTDSSWESAISDITNKEKGLYRLEQGGSMDEKR